MNILLQGFRGKEGKECYLSKLNDQKQKQGFKKKKVLTACQHSEKYVDIKIAKKIFINKENL